MSQGPLCPNLSQKVQAEVSQMANRNLSRVILLGGLSVNLNHLKTAFKSPHSPDQESQREERDSVIDAVKQITGAQTEIPGQGRMTVGDTPEYLWDTGYDGIQGFASRLRNRVSETSTPQGGQSSRGRPKMPPEPQRQFKQLKVYNETPAGRPLPTLRQIRQANLRKIFEEEGVDTPCNICGSPHHDYRNCTKEAY